MAVICSGGLRVSWALGGEAFMGPLAAALNIPPPLAHPRPGVYNVCVCVCVCIYIYLLILFPSIL